MSYARKRHCAWIRCTSTRRAVSGFVYSCLSEDCLLLMAIRRNLMDFSKCFSKKTCRERQKCSVFQETNWHVCIFINIKVIELLRTESILQVNLCYNWSRKHITILKNAVALLASLPSPLLLTKTACRGYVIAALNAFNIPLLFLIKCTVTLIFIYVGMTALLL
jgi:hypothetical protein